MKHIVGFLSIVSLLTLYGCKENASSPFDHDGQEVRNKIVVISDIHLGSDLSYSETVRNLPKLVAFLNDIGDSKTVKELVIGGDMVDEWFLPSRVDTYNGQTQADFANKIYQANKEVFDKLNEIIQENTVKVTYVPGNHDLLMTQEAIQQLLPGVHQSRDKDKLGLGTYSPDAFSQIAIEHCHRYDFFCAPSPYTNQEEAPGSILPPGYFFTRIATNSLLYNPGKEKGADIPEVPKPLATADEEQNNLYVYHQVWKRVLTDMIPVKDSLTEDMIVTNIDHFTGSRSISDLLPFVGKGGLLDVNLYKGAFTQNQWKERQAYCNVDVETNVVEAIVGSLETKFLDKQSEVQYFNNPKKKEVRIVVFGHTHLPMIVAKTNSQNQKCIYANSGTWIDSHGIDFVVITPQSEENPETKVSLYKYEEDGSHLLKEEERVVL